MLVSGWRDKNRERMAGEKNWFLFFGHSRYTLRVFHAPCEVVLRCYPLVSSSLLFFAISSLAALNIISSTALVSNGSGHTHRQRVVIAPFCHVVPAFLAHSSFFPRVYLMTVPCCFCVSVCLASSSASAGNCVSLIREGFLPALVSCTSCKLEDVQRCAAVAIANIFADPIARGEGEGSLIGRGSAKVRVASVPLASHTLFLTHAHTHTRTRLCTQRHRQKQCSRICQATFKRAIQLT